MLTTSSKISLETGRQRHSKEQTKSERPYTVVRHGLLLPSGPYHVVINSLGNLKFNEDSTDASSKTCTTFGIISRNSKAMHHANVCINRFPASNTIQI